MENIDIAKLETVLNIKISNVELYRTAFTHRSYLNEHPEYANPSNERLEFLGDSVLQVLSSEYLYNKYPDAPEGDLTNYRAAVVCTTSIANESRRLGYGEFLLLSNGERATGGSEREYILANTFEAVLGAMYIENGLEVCKTFATKELFYKVEDIVKQHLYKDAKSKFQELAQELKNITPNYEVMDSWGMDHEKTFRVGVYLAKELYGVGEGKSKQRAEQQAATDGLKKLTES